MRKYLIAALVLAAGCGSTRRDFKYCDEKYSVCDKGYACNFERETCEPIVEDGGPDTTSGTEVTPPLDVPPADAAVDGKDAPIIDTPPVDVPPVDVPVPDVPINLDTSLDTQVPDGPNTCGGDSDCKTAGLTVCVNNRCVACRSNAQCGGATPFCSATNTCVSCASATGDAGVCSGSTPVCDRGSGRCVECTQNGQCTASPAKAFCVANQCQGCNAPGASAGTGSPDGGVADGGAIDGGVVGPCLGAKPVCAASGTLAGQCVQCLTSSDCSGSKPICDSSNTCTGCTADSQCAALGSGPGVCMFPGDGRCVSESETIYVKNSSSCSGGSGTAGSPYCDTQAAINAVTSSKRVIVAKGPDMLSPVGSTPSGNPIWIIGQNGATFTGSGVVGIHVTAGEVYIRSVAVANGTKTGIVVESGTTLHLNRSVIKNNAGGGLLVNAGGSFDVGNCVFDGNGPGSAGPVAFGGVYLAGSAPAGKPRTFYFSTLVNNLDRGVVCADNTQSLSGMLLYGNVNGGFLNCAMDSTNSKWDSPGTGSDVADPAFSNANPYHLTTSSRCRDFIAASLTHPPDDLDGDSRPYPSTGKLDCGADEYRP